MSGSALAKTLKKTRGRAVEIYLQKAVTNANVSPSVFSVFANFLFFFFFPFLTLVVFLTHWLQIHVVKNARVKARARSP